MNCSRNTVLFYISSLFGNVYLERAIWILYYQSIGLSFLEISILQALINASMFLFDVPGGIFADKFGRKASLIVGRLLIIAYYVIVLSTTNVAALGAGSILFGAGMVCISGADQAFLFDSIKTEDSNDNYTKLYGIFNGLSLLTLSFSMECGGLIQKHSWFLVYFLSIVFQSCSLFFTTMLKENNRYHSAVDNVRDKSMSPRGLNISSASKFFITAVALFWGIASIYNMFNQKLLSSVGLPVSSVALIYAVGSPVVALFSMLAHRFENMFSSKIVLICGFLISGVLFSIIMDRSVYIYTVSFIGVSCLYNLTEPIVYNKLNGLVTSEKRATFLSFINVLSSAFMFVLLPGIGFLGDRLSLSMIFTVLGLISCILCIIGVVLEYRKRSITTIQ
ncbi:MFS transporter [Alicyclobacillus sacchari]|uniref:MFS transporter n=1 Tax=Alicyclobacillus sacchari TaxID=392010 RepID=A0A4R8L9L7_9BACL|nr:MFS transporter [Alicyclobacillus sacchari]